MASVSVSHLIIFIAAMVIAASTAGLLTTTVGDIGNAIEDQGLSASDDIRSDITIINDAGATSTENGSLTLYVKNTGSAQLPTQPSTIEILVNGVFESDIDEVRPLDGAEVWGTGDVVKIVVNTDDLGTGEHRVKVMVNGGEDVFVWEQ